MNLRLSLDQLRILRRPETALVVLILVVAVAWLYLDRQNKDPKAEVSGLDRSLQVSRDDLKFLDENYTLEALEKELEQLKSAPRPASLPSRQDALNFSSQLLTYATEQGLPLSTFDISEASAKVASGEYPVVRYSITTRGNLEPLVGSLKLLQDFRTATVQTLRFTRVAAAESQWEMRLELDVFHQKEGA